MPRTRTISRALLAGVAGAIGLTACGGGGSDVPAIGGPLPVSSAQVPSTYPPVPVNIATLGNVTYPQVSSVAKADIINARLLADAEGLRPRKVACNVSALRADTALLSFRWTCADQTGLTTTIGTATGLTLTLGDLFRPGYLEGLAKTAQTQLMASGVSAAEAKRATKPTPEAFAVWAVDSEELQVTFAVRGSPVTISFPLASLASILSPEGPLGQQTSP